MLINREREKLINAIIFFAKNTNACGKTKLFKLLYLLDFEHYSQVGRSVTGLDYFAFDKGPVPMELFEELKEPELLRTDMVAKIKFKLVPIKRGGQMLTIRPQADFDPSHFSKRELQIMEQLANDYKKNSSDEMIERTHLPNEPWHKVYEIEGDKSGLIPYEYAVSSDKKELTEYLANESKEVKNNYK